jgi:hypothetical protein
METDCPDIGERPTATSAAAADGSLPMMLALMPRPAWSRMRPELRWGEIGIDARAIVVPGRRGWLVDFRSPTD